jgi:hypothetical protein
VTRWLASTAVTAATALGAAGACSDATTIGVTELNLDRPVDVSFACYGPMRQTNGRTTANPNDPIVTAAMPNAVCQALSPPVTPRDSGGNAIAATPFPGQDNLPANPNEPNQSCAQNPCWYGFFLQSASGTVALAQWPALPADQMLPTNGLSPQFSDTIGSLFSVLDADPLTPGKNALSIGEDPVALGTDKTGCFEITANAGSCDLSELDITSALSNIVEHNPVRPRIDRVSVLAPNGAKILSKPSAMIVEPFLGPSGDPTVAAGPDTAGNACPAAATGKVYIAYPSCHLVAEVQLGAGADGKATASVIGGIQFDATGTPSVLTGPALANLSCPTECPPDPGVPVVNATGMRPVALDYRLDPRIDPRTMVKTQATSRLAIGSDIRATAPAAPVTVVDLDLTTFAPVPATLLSIPLEGNGGPVSVSALALSAQIGMGGDLSRNPSGSVDDNTNDQAQYVYAVASDGTVRVADVLNVKRECDTQIDGRFLRTIGPTPLECLQPGRPDLPRRPGARSPGIELPGGAVATSVALIKGLSAVPEYATATTTTPPPPLAPLPAQAALLVGYFAVITTSSGSVYVVNVDDDYVPDNVSPIPGQALATSPVLVMAHQLRDSLSDRENLPADCTATDGSGASTGGPRLTAPPVQQFTTGTLFDDLDAQLPRLQQVACDIGAFTPAMPAPPLTALEFGAPEVQTDATAGPAVARDTVYPELKSLASQENWTLTYEGTLELDSTIPSTNGPSIHSAQAFVDRTGMFIADVTQPFCHIGVEPFDVVELQGCDPAHLDADCPAGYTCYVHPSSTVNIGACFLKTEAPRLQDTCRDFLSTTRRYTVGTDASGGVSPGKLVLLQRMHELSTTPIDGCMNDAQCDDLARAAVVINQSADLFREPVGGQAQTSWSCMADPLRKPIGATPDRNKRCVQQCTYTPRTAQNQNTNAKAPFCANGTVCMPIAPPDPSSTDGVPGVCMEGIEPPQACLSGPQRYVVRAGEAFAVIGDHTGFVHPIVTSPDGTRCVRDPRLDKDPLSIGRIPLTAPACSPSADPYTGLIGSTGQFEANPCSLTVQEYEYTTDYSACPDGGVAQCANHQAPPCADGQAPVCPDGQPPPHYGTCRSPTRSVSAATRMNVPAIKFRNRALTLTLVDPYRSSADACTGRHPGNVAPTNIPLVVPGYQIGFAVKAGVFPYTLPLIGQEVSPVKVVRGPSESIWVVDDGDFVGNGITDVSTRGRVFRVESAPAPAPATNSSAQVIVNTMQ